jgi:hypothetical protein
MYFELIITVSGYRDKILKSDFGDKIYGKLIQDIIQETRGITKVHLGIILIRDTLSTFLAPPPSLFDIFLFLITYLL